MTVREKKGRISMLYRAIDIVVRVLANGPRGRISVPGQILPISHKIVLDVSLLNTPLYGMD